MAIELVMLDFFFMSVSDIRTNCSGVLQVCMLPSRHEACGLRYSTLAKKTYSFPCKHSLLLIAACVKDLNQPFEKC